jgi:hypothetical protein
MKHRRLFRRTRTQVHTTHHASAQPHQDNTQHRCAHCDLGVAGLPGADGGERVRHGHLLRRSLHEIFSSVLSCERGGFPARAPLAFPIEQVLCSRACRRCCCCCCCCVLQSPTRRCRCSSTRKPPAGQGRLCGSRAAERAALGGGGGGRRGGGAGRADPRRHRPHPPRHRPHLRGAPPAPTLHLTSGQK